jgi:hypothetical protein
MLSNPFSFLLVLIPDFLLFTTKPSSCAVFLKVVVGASVERGSSLPRSQQHSSNNAAAPSASSASSSSSHIGAAGPVGSLSSSSSSSSSGSRSSGGGSPNISNGEHSPALLTASAVASGNDRNATLELLWRFFLGASLATLCPNDGTADKNTTNFASATAGSDAIAPKSPPKSGSGGGASFVKEEYVVQDGDTVMIIY